MTRYPAVIDGERGAYGVVIPDMPGACCAMGDTVDEALANAEDVLADFVDLLEADGVPVPLTQRDRRRGAGSRGDGGVCVVESACIAGA